MNFVKLRYLNCLFILLFTDIETVALITIVLIVLHAHFTDIMDISVIY